MKELYTEIEINASPKCVWNALTDLKNYKNWNSFITHVEGNLEIGSSIHIRIKPPGKKEGPYQVKILKLENEKEFQWIGKMYIGFILTGDHRFEIYKLSGNRTKLVHREFFSGILVPFAWKSFLNTTFRKGFERFNESLKIYVENLDSKLQEDQ